MNKLFTILSLSALIATPAFAKTMKSKPTKPAVVAADAAAKPAEGTAPADGAKKDEAKPVKKTTKKGTKAKAGDAKGGEAKGGDAAKPAEAAPAAK